MRLRVMVDGAVAGRLRAWATGDLPARRQAMIERAGEAAREVARQATPVRTGRARAGWSPVSVEDAGTTTQARFGNDVEYVKYLEYGTRQMPPLGMVAQGLEAGRRALGGVLDDAGL